MRRRTFASRDDDDGSYKPIEVRNLAALMGDEFDTHKMLADRYARVYRLLAIKGFLRETELILVHAEWLKRVAPGSETCQLELQQYAARLRNDHPNEIYGDESLDVPVSRPAPESHTTCFACLEDERPPFSICAGKCNPAAVVCEPCLSRAIIDGSAPTQCPFCRGSLLITRRE